MKTHLIFTLLLSLSLSIQAQKSWMDNAVLWKSYHQQDEKAVEQNHLTNSVNILTNAKASRSLNYRTLISNASNIQDEAADLSKMTLFIVYWNQDTTREQLLWSIADQEKDYVLSTTERLADLSKYQFLNYVDQSKSQPQIQTYFQHEKEMPTGSLKFGQPPMNTAIPVENFRGAIAEIILFEQVLSPSKRQQIQTYLALKYGIPLAENYISATDKVLKAVKNASFTHRIAGLGRNDVFQLHQKQSGSSILELSLSIGLNEIEKENRLNQDELNDNAYLIWSDNNESLQLQQRQILEIPSLERLWEISVSGDVNDVSTELQIDCSSINMEQDQQLYLIIYEDENKQQKRYHPAAEITKKGIATFKNINWNNDQSGKDYFSFALGNALIPSIEIQFPQCTSNQNGQLELAAIGGQAPYKFELRRDDGKKIGTWKLDNENETQLVELAVGDYQLILSDKNGLQYSENFFFQAADAPASILEDQYFLAENTTLTLDAALNNPNVIYQWKNETEQVLSNQSSLNIKEAGIYQLTLEEEGCISKHSIEVLQLNEERNILSFDLSPNPSTDGYFNLQAQFDQAAESRLNIYNLKGQLLKTIDFGAASAVDYQDDLLDNGVYLIELQTRKSKMAKKLIVQIVP